MDTWGAVVHPSEPFYDQARAAVNQATLDSRKAMLHFKSGEFVKAARLFEDAVVALDQAVGTHEHALGALFESNSKWNARGVRLPGSSRGMCPELFIEAEGNMVKSVERRDVGDFDQAQMLVDGAIALWREGLTCDAHLVEQCQRFISDSSASNDVRWHALEEFVAMNPLEHWQRAQKLRDSVQSRAVQIGDGSASCW